VANTNDPCPICGAQPGSPIEEHWRREWLNTGKAMRILWVLIGFPFWIVYQIGRQTDWELEHFDE
jgi:hypothetical protein